MCRCSFGMVQLQLTCAMVQLLYSAGDFQVLCRWSQVEYRCGSIVLQVWCREATVQSMFCRSSSGLATIRTWYRCGEGGIQVWYSCVHSL